MIRSIFYLISDVTNGTYNGMTKEELIKWRKKQNLRQEDLADLLGIARVSVTRWENGTRQIPSFLHWALESIARHLKGGAK